MALKLQKTTNYGINLNNAYARIVCFNGNKECIDIYVSFYADVTARNENRFPIASSGYSFKFNEDSNSNIIKQGYEYLKTLDEFKYAEDC